MPKEIERFLSANEKESMRDGKRKYQLFLAIMVGIEKLLTLGAVSRSMVESYIRKQFALASEV